MTSSRRLKDLDWIGLALWIFRAAIIILVVVGTVRKLFFGVGTQYTGRDWLDFAVSGLSQGDCTRSSRLATPMVYGVLFMINFAHGEFFMSGAMTSTMLVASTLSRSGFMDKQPIIYLVIVTFVSVLTAMCISLLTERIAYRPLRRARSACAAHHCHWRIILLAILLPRPLRRRYQTLSCSGHSGWAD